MKLLNAHGWLSRLSVRDQIYTLSKHASWNLISFVIEMYKQTRLIRSRTELRIKVHR